MIAATAPDAQAERGDLGDAAVLAVDIDAGCPVETPGGDALSGKQVDDCLFDARDEVLDLEAAPGEIDQQIENDLAGAVVGDLSAAINPDERNRGRTQEVLGFAGLAERIDRWVLATPDFIGGGWGPCGGEIDHRLPGRLILRPPEAAKYRRVDQSTTLTKGWLESSRYSASSCGFEVALMVQVRLTYLPVDEARISMVAPSKSGA